MAKVEQIRLGLCESSYISYLPTVLATPSSPYHLMPIKISITIELFTWPRRRVPLGIWTRVRTRLQRGSFLTYENADEDCFEHPPLYIGHDAPPAIMITLSTPTSGCIESATWYKARTAAASGEQFCEMERSGTCEKKQCVLTVLMVIQIRAVSLSRLLSGCRLSGFANRFLDCSQ